METARPYERPLEWEADESDNLDLFLVPPPPYLTSVPLPPPPLPPRPNPTTSNASSASSTNRATSPNSARSSVTEGAHSSSSPPFPSRSNNNTSASSSGSQIASNNNSTSLMLAEIDAADAAAAPPSSPCLAASSCSKIQRPSSSANDPASASAPLARRPLADISARPPRASLPSSSSSFSSSCCNGSAATTQRAASSSPAILTAPGHQRSGGGGGGGGSGCGGGSCSSSGSISGTATGSGGQVPGALRPPPVPVAAGAVAAPASASSSALGVSQPTEASFSKSSASALLSDNGKKGSWNWGKLGRSLVGTVLGPAAVGRVSDGGGGGKGVGLMAPARELSEPEVQLMPDGKVNVSVWRKNKQDLHPVKVQVGMFDSAYEGERAAECFCPPKWQEPAKDSRCAVCDSTFGFVYSRRHHCRNCGRLVCSSCSETFWPRSMLPSTYRVDTSEKKVRVCSTCHGASENFRKALLSGSAEDSMAAYSTGCVNLRSPYTIYGSELPVHCAAAGGNLSILAWLVEDQCCPLFFDSAKTIALGDSEKRSVMAAAAASGHIHIMRYLAFSQGCKVTEIKEVKALWCALNKFMYEGSDVAPANEANNRPSLRPAEASPTASGGDGCDGTGGGGGGGFGGGDGGGNEVGGIYPTAPPMPGSQDGAEVAPAVSVDETSCIVCFERKVDCTLVPCGHHCCCLICAAQFEQCPVCRADVEQKIRAISV